MAELIVALDYTDALDALNMAASLRGQVKWMKVGMELFTREGPRVVQTLHGMGFKVMLDLKFFDVPNTVRGGVRAASFIGADMLTLHLLGGERMCRAALEEAANLEHKPLLFGVTVLTSMEDKELPGFSASIDSLAHKLAISAANLGFSGVVCAGQDITGIKKSCPNLQCLCPGIRPAASDREDQRRTSAPGEAVTRGADFLVVGRPITRADDPLKAVRTILEEMGQK